MALDTYPRKANEDLAHEPIEAPRGPTRAQGRSHWPGPQGPRGGPQRPCPQEPRGATWAWPSRAKGGPQGIGPQGPGEVHRGLAHESPGGPQPTRAQGVCYERRVLEEISQVEDSYKCNRWIQNRHRHIYHTMTTLGQPLGQPGSLSGK